MEFSSVVPDIRNNVVGKSGYLGLIQSSSGSLWSIAIIETTWERKVGSFLFLGAKNYSCFSSSKR